VTKYRLIKCSGGYWLEEGGVTTRQCKGERFATREDARAEIRKWLHPDEKAWIVRVVARKRRAHGAC